MMKRKRYIHPSYENKPLSNLDIEYWKQILEYQNEIAPFTPSMAEIAEALGLSAKSHVHALLGHLHRHGLVVTRETGSKTQYYAVTKDLRALYRATCEVQS